MSQQFSDKSATLSKQLRFFLIFILIVGIFFRFNNLSHKFYWHDEVDTSLRISGYTTQEVIQDNLKGQIINAQDLQRYQQISAKKGLSDTLKSLAVESPPLSPLYYVMARFWVQGLGDTQYSLTPQSSPSAPSDTAGYYWKKWFSNPTVVTRSFSALLSLLVFPGFYLVCLELFKTPFAGWIGLIVLSISPLQVLLAQEAHYDSLWAATILFSSWALLRSHRISQERPQTSHLRTWGIYTLTLTVGFYSCLLTGLIAIAHGLYLYSLERYRWTKTLMAFSLSLLVALVAFMPWLIFLLTFLLKNRFSLQPMADWSGNTLDKFYLFKNWPIYLNSLFLDLGFSFEYPTQSLLDSFSKLSLAVTLGLIGYSIYFHCRSRRQPTEKLSAPGLFILAIAGVNLVTLALLNLVLGGKRLAVVSDLMPLFLSIQLAVTGLLAHQLALPVSRKKRLWQGAIALLIVSGITSCIVSSQPGTWWHKAIGYENPQIAKVINQASHPLIISRLSDIGVKNIISLSYLLAPKVQLQLLDDSTLPKVPDGFSEVFLLHPTSDLRQKLAQDPHLKLAPVSQVAKDVLWKLSAS